MQSASIIERADEQVRHRPALAEGLNMQAAAQAPHQHTQSLLEARMPVSKYCTHVSQNSRCSTCLPHWSTRASATCTCLPGEVWLNSKLHCQA